MCERGADAGQDDYASYRRRLFEKFVTPYYQTRGFDLTNPEMLAKAGDLRFYSASLKASRNVRLVSNRNDFLLTDEDYDWLTATFSPEHLTVFEKGGHLGNLSHAAVQQAILKGLADLTPPDPKPE